MLPARPRSAPRVLMPPLAFQLLPAAPADGGPGAGGPAEGGGGIEELTTDALTIGGPGGVKLVGFTPDNGWKLLISLGLVAAVVLSGLLARRLLTRLIDGRAHPNRLFWGRQVVNLTGAFVLILGLVSVWFDDPSSLTTAFGLVTAGLAFALQKVVTSVAGYFVILRGNNFRVGDRIVMGGVRGDVLAVRFTQTVIMEMGQPPSVQAATPEVWVPSRQYTGRVVCVPNAKIFEEPIYNYSSEFPFIWEELTLPVTYECDRDRAEEILRAAAAKHAVSADRLGAEDLRELQRRYPIELAGLDPRVFWRITDNWLELSVRFVAEEHGVRGLKDAMSREILSGLDAAGIGIASATYDIVGLPPVRVRNERAGAESDPGA